MANYTAVLGLPGARFLLVAGAGSRLGAGMTPLALLLLVQGATGRYWLAGIVGGCYALAGAVTGPVLGRLADRFGSARVLRATAVAHPAALAVLLAFRDAVGPACLAAAVAGATYPPLTAAVRGAWNGLTEGTTHGL